MVPEVPALSRNSPVPYQLRKFTVRAECVRMSAEVAYHLNESLLHRRHVQFQVAATSEQSITRQPQHCVVFRRRPGEITSLGLSDQFRVAAFTCAYPKPRKNYVHCEIS